jgi:hypothetical protein
LIVRFSIVNYDYATYGAMGSALECANLKTGALRTIFNYTTASSEVLVATGTPFTPGFGSSINYLNGVVMAPFSVQNIPGGYYGAVPASLSDGKLVWPNQTYGFSMQPDEMLLYAPNGADADASTFQVIGGVTFADGENEPYTKHLFRYKSLNTEDNADWFVNVSTPVGMCLMIQSTRITPSRVLTDYVGVDDG